MSLESPENEKNFPDEDGRKRDSSRKRDGKRDKKEKGYTMFEEEESEEDLTLPDDVKSPTKVKKNKPGFKFPVKKDIFPRIKEKEEKKDKEGKKEEKEKKKEEKEGKKGKDKEKKKSKHARIDLKPAPPVIETCENPIFGIPLALAVERNKSHDGVQLPAIVRECIDYIEECGLTCEGIYRISGVKSKVQQLKEAYNKGTRVDLVEQEPTVVATLLKQFLRELPEPVLTTSLMHKFEEASTVKNEKKKVEMFIRLIEDLPACNRLLLSWVIVHMTHIIELQKENKMSLQNVSIVLSPTMQISHRVLNALFTLAHQIFKDTYLKKYVPPLKPATSRWSLELPDSTLALEEELCKQESLLNQLHVRLNAGHDDPLAEEQLWEVQRVITQLKRKIKFAKKSQGSADRRRKEADARRSSQLSSDTEELHLELRAAPATPPATAPKASTTQAVVELPPKPQKTEAEGGEKRSDTNKEKIADDTSLQKRVDKTEGKAEKVSEDQQQKGDEKAAEEIKPVKEGKKDEERAGKESKSEMQEEKGEKTDSDESKMTGGELRQDFPDQNKRESDEKSLPNQKAGKVSVPKETEEKSSSPKENTEKSSSLQEKVDKSLSKDKTEKLLLKENAEKVSVPSALKASKEKTESTEQAPSEVAATVVSEMGETKEPLAGSVQPVILEAGRSLVLKPCPEEEEKDEEKEKDREKEDEEKEKEDKQKESQAEGEGEGRRGKEKEEEEEREEVKLKDSLKGAGEVGEARETVKEGAEKVKQVSIQTSRVIVEEREAAKPRGPVQVHPHLYLSLEPLQPIKAQPLKPRRERGEKTEESHRRSAKLRELEEELLGGGNENTDDAQQQEKTELDEQQASQAAKSAEEEDFDEELAEEEELQRLVEEEFSLRLEEEELLAIGDELRKKIETEESEIERLQQEIQELQYLRHDSDLEEMSSNSDSSYESEDEEEMNDMLSSLLEENLQLEKENAEMCQKIHEERMICLSVKLHIRLLQQKQLESSHSSLLGD